MLFFTVKLEAIQPFCCRNWLSSWLPFYYRSLIIITQPPQHPRETPQYPRANTTVPKGKPAATKGKPPAATKGKIDMICLLID